MSKNDIDIRVLDVGRQSKKAIKRLKQGLPGPLSDEIQSTIADSVALAHERSGKTVVPVIIVYERKKKKKKGPLGLMSYWVR